MADEEQTTESVQPDSQSSGGLLDDVQLAPASTEETVEEMDHVDKKVNGKKPEYIADRFFDVETGEIDVEALGKSQAELYKQMRNGRHIVPEKEDYDTEFIHAKVPADDPMLAKFKEVAKERGLTQDDFQSVIGMVIENMPEQEQEPVDVERIRAEEMAALGPKGQDILNGHVTWAQSLVDKSVWTEDDFEEFKVWGGTASGIKALTRLRQYYGEKTIPVHVNVEGNGMDTEDELQALVGDPRMQTDPVYRKKVYDRFDRKYGFDGLSPELN